MRFSVLGPDTIGVYASVTITLGAPGKSPTTQLSLVTEIAIRTSEGWRIAGMITVPAP
jgi:hypothetical protein